jgi:hypothetical protein
VAALHEKIRSVAQLLNAIDDVRFIQQFNGFIEVRHALFFFAVFLMIIVSIIKQTITSFMPRTTAVSGGLGHTFPLKMWIRKLF